MTDEPPVSLPIRTGPRRIALGFLATIFCLLGAHLSLQILWPLVLVLLAPSSLGTWLLLLTIAAVVAPTAGFVLLNAAIYAAEALHRAPVIVIDPEGFYDARSFDRPVPWSAISNAEPAPFLGFSGVRLTLRPGARAEFNHTPAWLGWLHEWGRQPEGVVLIPTALQTVSGHVLAHTIAEMVRRHGVGKHDLPPPPGHP